MRYITIGIIALLLVMGLYYSESEDPKNPSELLKNISSVHDDMMNITNYFNYTNLYENEPTTKNVMFNIINPIIYAVVVELNTILPIATYAVAGQYHSLIFKVVIIMLILYVVLLIPKIVIAIITLYFFIKEKKKNKEKIWD